MNRNPLSQTVMPLTLMLLTVVVMQTAACGFAAAPQPKPETLSQQLERTEELVTAGDWTGAATSTAELKQTWEQLRTKVQARTVPSVISQVESSLSRLETAVKTRDQSLALETVNQLQTSWKSIAPSIP